MPLERRKLLAGLGLTLAAPAIVRTPGLLMPVRSPRSPVLRARVVRMSDDILKVEHYIEYMTPNQRAIFFEQTYGLGNAVWLTREQMEQEYPMIGEA